MKKSLIKIVFITLTFLICAAIGFSVFFNNSEKSAKQEVTPFPTLKTEEGNINTAFFSELSDYVAENVMFRDYIISLNAKLCYNLFGISTEKQVIAGSDGVMFFDKTVNDYCGIEPIKNREAFIIADTLSQLQSYCESKNVKFLFTIAPNKNTLYPEYMPKRFIKAQEFSIDTVEKALKDNDISYLSLKDLFLEQNEMLYYKQDTHWNHKGAVMVYNAILQSLGKDGEDYSNVSYKKAEHTGDLARMLFPALTPTETEEIPDYKFTYAYISRFKSEDDIIIKTVENSADGSLIMYRDSFGNSLLPYFAQAFGRMYYTRAASVDANLIDLQSADYFVYEIVERNLRNITKYTPIMEASPASITAGSVSDFQYTISSRDMGHMTHFYGYVDLAYLTDSSKIYIKINDSFYECFNIFEEQLIDSKNDLNGFSVYIPSEILNEDNTISVAILSDSLTQAKKNNIYNKTKGFGV